MIAQCVVATEMPTTSRVYTSMTVARYTVRLFHGIYVKSATHAWCGCDGVIIIKRFGYSMACFFGFLHFRPLRRYALIPKMRITRWTGFLFMRRCIATRRNPYDGNSRRD